MTRLSNGKMFAAVLALTGAALVLPTAASANSSNWSHSKQARIEAHHHAIWRQAYRAGYHRGLREGRLASVAPVETGRSAYVAPVVAAPLGYGGPFAGDGLLGTGVLDGRGVAGTGVLSGTGVLGLGIAGF